QYADSLGVLPDELQPAIQSLVGELIIATTKGPVEVTESLIKRHLVKATDARLLDYRGSACAHEAARQRIRTFMQYSLGVDPPYLIHRRFFASLDQAAATYPIIFVIGRGGCGKSTLAAQFLLERPATVLSLAQLAEFYEEGWLSKEFNRCRSQAEHHLL